jgi:TrmH family RNA methyltransferase
LITSNSNSTIKLVKSLHHKKGRDEHKLFLAEGIHLVQEALQAGWKVQFYLWTAKLGESVEGRELLERLQTVAPGYEVNEAVFKGAAETESPTGIIAVLPLPAPVEFDLSDVSLGLIVDGVQDPGNIGTIIRTAWASGIRKLIFTPKTADPYQGKVVRSSMGGIFNVRIFRNEPPGSIIAAAGQKRIQVVAGDVRADRTYFEADLTVPTLILIGSEGRGIAPDWENFSIQNVLIPQPGKAESLNVAVSAGILIYEALRQRLNMDTCKS